MDTFYVFGALSGTIQSLDLNLSSGGDDAPWQCRTIVVRNLVTGMVQEFPVGRWLPDASGSLSLTAAAQ